MNITVNDISRRLRNRDAKLTEASLTPRLYTEHNVFCTDNAVYAITHWESLAETSNEAFNKALDVFAEVCINSNKSIINTCCDYLVENVDKVRDATQLFNSLKYRSSRLKRKVSTKVSKQYDPVNAAIRNSIKSINNTLQTNGVAPQNSANNESVEECFNRLLTEAKKMKECDRITENYNKICKRFNIDKIITETSTPNDVYVAIIEIAKCIDTYNIPFKNKFSHALEASYYAINMHNMNYDAKSIIESVTDYFIFSSGISESNAKDIKEVKDISIVFEQGDFDCISYIYEDSTNALEDNEYNVNDLIESYCYPINEDGIVKQFKSKEKEVKKATRKLIKDAKKGNPDERLDRKTQREISDFRKECAKDPDNKNNIVRLKSLITGIFTKTPYQIVYDLPNFFGIIRASFIITSASINPVLGLVTFITNEILKLHLSRKQTEKIVKAYQSEIDSVRNKLESAKDEESKNNFNKYLEELEKDYAKIKEYENDLYSEDENDERDTSTEYGKNNDDDDDWGFDDWDDFDFEEAASIVYISDMMQSISEGLIDDNIEGIVFNNLYKLDNDSIDNIADFSITVPVILEKDKLCEALIEYRDNLRESANNVDDYIRIDCLNENIYKLRENSRVYATSNNLSGIRCYLSCLNEMVKMNTSEHYITEMNFSNTLKLAVNKLKQDATKLKDKDKQVSSSIDAAVSNISKDMETALMNDNREAVIKGRILPSASKCIKIACTLGVAWAISPAIAVIGAVGAFACSQKLKAKERQLVMDDIDIELKMVERYIKQAEDENDLKKVRQLEIIQRNLQRQQQRIKYKMHVIYKQDVPNVAGSDD
jgi:hypothetical protein